ncbi:MULTISPECIES: DNA polymerase Y family protein [unclassified Pannonibacter]|uniref:Y-family DNA polymerase n=1 Tax=unclassified Pannonibacter TaxID=2627228 RepID=UPI001646BC99|nr:MULTISPECIES: DNA polymerase Y family protein [unclassified Pannonibacter]
MTRALARRVLCIWFPRLASDRILRLRPHDGPFAISLNRSNSEHIHCLNRAAETRGLRRGMSLADARALCPQLVSEPADLPGERQFLAALGRWAGRYGPMVGRDGADGLVADITGVPHLFGGEEGLLADLHGRFSHAGLTVAAAIAGTRGAAYALSRHGGGIAPPGEALAAIGALPPSALRIDGETASGLQQMGLRSIRDLTQVPRAPLARRFGASLMLRLDQALGLAGEPVSPDGPPPHFGARITLPEPVGLVDDVMAGLTRLLERLCEKLTAVNLGARRLHVELRRVDGDLAQLDVGLARPMRDPAAIARLFARSIEKLDAGFGFDQLRMTVSIVEEMQPQQLTSAGEGEAEGKLADLITRIGNRLGFDAVRRHLPADSHIPERSYLAAPAAFSRPEPFPQSGPRRPLILFPPEPLTAQGTSPPARFSWRRMRFTLGRASGPERLSPEWWLDDPAWRRGLRDYWFVETREGRRLWLFHTPQDPGWYVHGEFA